MRKIINTLKYGDGRTKLVLLLTMFTGAGTIALFVLAVVFNMMFLFFGGVICAFLTITLAQTFGIRSGDIPETRLVDDSSIGNIVNNVDGVMQPAQNMSDNVSTISNSNYMDNTTKEQDSNDRAKKDKTAKEKKIKEKSTTESDIVPETESPASIEKRQNASLNDTDDNSIADLQDKNDTEIDFEKRVKNNDPVYVREVLEKYTKKTIKKTLHRYKVKKDHRMVIIDQCKKLGIWQTPAFVWVSDKEFNILVIESEPRHFTLPIFSIKEVTYLKKQPGDAEKDYTLFKGNSIIAELFRPYLPDYSYSSKVDDLTPYKNLYGIGPDIYFTNTSAEHIFDLLGVKFFVEDKITTSNKANYFFKEIYKCNILLRDSVYDANMYADKVSNILDDMAHSTISKNEFRDTLNLLIKNKLITQEFASHFAEIRDKISR